MNARYINQVVLCPQDLMSQPVFSICWNPEEVVSNYSNGMEVLARARASRQREFPFFHDLYIGF